MSRFDLDSIKDISEDNARAALRDICEVVNQSGDGPDGEPGEYEWSDGMEAIYRVLLRLTVRA